MTMSFTSEILNEVEDFASLTAAQRCGIENALDLNVVDRLAAIQEKSQKLYEAIKLFFSSQRAWHEFHLKMHNEGKQGSMNARDSVEQAEKNDNFNNSRKQFIQAIKSYDGE